MNLDDNITRELLKLKEELEVSHMSKEQQKEAIKAILPMLNREQKARLAKIVELIDK